MNIPGFEIIEQLGEGGIATVWKARQASLDRLVALKVLKPHFARDPAEVRSFVNEARTAARVKHPNLVHVHDVGESDGMHYCVMEYIAGHTLATVVRDEGPMPPKQALDVALCVAGALEAAWEQGRVVHRDVKPSNIMVDADGTVKLGELGVPKMVDAARLRDYLAGDLPEGVPSFISPEQAQCTDAVDCRTDMYGLGATLYYLLTGVVPFDGASPLETAQRHVTDFLPHPREVNPSLPANVGPLLSRLMMKKPEDRYPDWSAAIAAIRKTAAGRILLGQKDAASTIQAPKATAASASPPSSRPARLPAAVHVAAGAALIAWWVWLAAALTRQPPPGVYAPPPPLPPVQAKPVPPPPAPSPTPAPAARTEPDLSRKALTRDVARLLLREEYGQALVAIGQAQSDAKDAAARAEAATLRAFVAEVGRMYDIVEAQLRAKLGEPVALRLRQGPCQAVIGKVEQGVVEAAVVSSAGGTEKVRFSVRDLEPVEVVRWLGSSDAPEASAMRCILYAKASDAENAARFAGTSGLLAEAFQELLRTPPRTP